MLLVHNVKEVTMKVRFSYEESFIVFLLFTLCRRLHLSLWWSQTIAVPSYCHCPAAFPATRRRQPALRKLRSILLTTTQNLLPSLITLPTYTFLLLLLPILPSVKSLRDSCSCEISQIIVFQCFYISHLSISAIFVCPCHLGYIVCTSVRPLNF